jgi:hypothetical protein
MVITTLQQVIDERISFLKEQVNHENKQEVNDAFQVQIFDFVSLATYSASHLNGKY